MLDSMRKHASGPVAKILIGILIISFGVWGVAGALSGIGTNTVAEVGNTEISVVDFDRAYRRELQNLSQQVGTQITPDQASQLSPAQVTEIATHAEQQHAGVIDEVSQFYAQHSGLIKTLGGAAIAIALAKMKENATRG